MTTDAPARPREVAPGVALFAARTPTLLPATHTNSYALGGRDVILVEPATPYEDERRAWVSWARELSSSGRRLLSVLATHHHDDHVGGAAFFADALGLPIWAHRETAARMSAPVARMLDEGDALVLDGPTPQRWDVLHTPGHAPGHVSLHEPSLKVSVVGDMVASKGTILIAPGDGDMGEYLRQLARLRDLDAALVLPAHGEPIETPRALYEHYVSHRLAREQLVLRALMSRGQEGSDAGGLVAAAYADTPPAVWPLATLSLEMHLRKLVEDGRARCDGDRYVAEEISP